MSNAHDSKYKEELLVSPTTTTNTSLKIATITTMKNSTAQLLLDRQYVKLFGFLECISIIHVATRKIMQW